MTRIVLISSALALAAIGLAGTFVPHELLGAYGVAEPGLQATLLVQLLGALALGFAMLNWMNRQQVIGGIYGRPVAQANAIQFTCASLALLKGVSAGARDPLTLALAAVWSIFALLFLRILFSSPSAPPRD